MREVSDQQAATSGEDCDTKHWHWPESCPCLFFLLSSWEQFCFIPALHKPKGSVLQFALLQPIELFARYLNSSTRNQTFWQNNVATYFADCVPQEDRWVCIPYQVRHQGNSSGKDEESEIWGRPGEKKNPQKHKNRKAFYSFCKVLNSHKSNTRNSLTETSI